MLDSSQSNAATVAFPITSACLSLPLSYRIDLQLIQPVIMQVLKFRCLPQLSVNISQYVTITTYLNDVQQEFSTGLTCYWQFPLVIVHPKLLQALSLHLPFNEIRLTISQPLGINLNTISIYRSIIKRYFEGPPLGCNLSSELYQPAFPVELSSDETGFSGLACLACEINYQLPW